MTTQKESGTNDHEEAKSGTIYWTLSLYIDADKLAETLGSGSRIAPDVFRQLQRNHKPSLALANAVDPLMNDIADRETQGEMQEFLLAATADDFPDMRAARAAVRRYETLKFRLPTAISWSTEGVEFQAAPEGLEREREVQLRRFWLSHNNGALSYHLSFSHYYGADQDPERSGYDPSTLYFLSVLQKLAAPKEYSLRDEAFKTANGNTPPYVNVFDEEDLGIDPLDHVKIEHSLRRGEDGPKATKERFWSFVETAFEIDAEVLFTRMGRPGKRARGQFRKTLLDLAPFIEVPGLAAPKSRFMFMLHDKRFFDRLMPLDPVTNETLSRKLMVQPACYEPYEAVINKLRRKAEAEDAPAVVLDENYWRWVRERPEYEDAVADGGFERDNPDFKSDQDEDEANPARFSVALDDGKTAARDRLKVLIEAVRQGHCRQNLRLDEPLNSRSDPSTRRMAAPEKRHIPAFEAGRSDCLEYLFLAGFNQNIIDFMNQDTSEILDSIDPIYPDSEDQSSDRFFVRYANHRAMITYVPRSRSLETGNDYIGACPYAFLIHVLALHNEFLARRHEQKTMARIERIECLIDGRPLPTTEAMEELERSEPLEDDEPPPAGTLDDEDARRRFAEAERYRKAEVAINRAKLAEFNQYEQFRYANPFRYETERDVFQTLEDLRGISRKQAALGHAIKTLEEHASDLSRRQQHKADEIQRQADRRQKIADDAAAARQKEVDDKAARRGALLNFLLAMTGVFGAGQMFYWIGEKAADGGETGGVAGLLARFLGLEKPVEAPRRLLDLFPASTKIGEGILTFTEWCMFIALFVFVATAVSLIVWAVFEGVRGIFTQKKADKKTRSGGR